MSSFSYHHYMVGFLKGRITLSAPPSLHGEWTVGQWRIDKLLNISKINMNLYFFRRRQMILVYILKFRPNGTCNGKQVVAKGKDVFINYVFILSLHYINSRKSIFLVIFYKQDRLIFTYKEQQTSECFYNVQNTTLWWNLLK